MNFTVRRAGLADAPALSLIGQATFLESYYMDVARDDMIAHLKATYSERHFKAHLQEPRGAMWLAEFEPLDLMRVMHQRWSLRWGGLGVRTDMRRI